MQLEESNTSSSRTVELEKEVKEKNLLISKLRHEGAMLYLVPLMDICQRCLLAQVSS